MDFMQMFKQFGDMKGRMDEIKQRMSKMRIVGESGAGMVKVTVNGDGQVLKVDIDRAMLAPEDNEMLEELIVSAVNDAVNRAREALAHEMKSLTGGMNIPGLEKLLGGL